MKYKSVEEGSKAEEFHVSCDQDDSFSVSLNIQVSSGHFLSELFHEPLYLQDCLMPEVLYKINIMALVSDINKLPVESRPLHDKVIITDGELTLYKEADSERRQSVFGCSSLSPVISREVSRSIPH